MSKATLHLICGSIGAGKTTYALALSQQVTALHFSIDQWMVALYGQDAPEPLQWTWVAARVARCEAQIARLAVRCADLGISSVLDQTFLTTEDRKRVAGIAEQAGLAVRLHYLNVPAAERWRRICVRNEKRGETFSMPVSRATFDFIERLWQPPTPAEMAAYNGVYVASDASFASASPLSR